MKALGSTPTITHDLPGNWASFPSVERSINIVLITVEVINTLLRPRGKNQ